MRQFRRVEAGVEDSKIKPGDIVRLVYPFRPERYSLQKYAFGIVVGVVKEGSSRSKHNQSSSESHYWSELDEVIIHLIHDPHSSTIYVDQFGIKALFSFDSDEVELYKANQTVSE